MGAKDNDERLVSRRRFMGWGATLLTAAVLPGATLWLTEAPAGATTTAQGEADPGRGRDPLHLAPYALPSWQSLVQRSVQAATPGTTGTALLVVRVTDRAVTTARRMTGDVFSIEFQASRPWRPGLYTVTASGLGSFPLFIDGTGRTASAVINRRVPT